MSAYEPETRITSSYEISEGAANQIVERIRRADTEKAEPLPPDQTG